jgi:hypothetical protein
MINNVPRAKWQRQKNQIHLRHFWLFIHDMWDLQKQEMSTRQKKWKNILLTCEECKDFEHSCLHREINTFRHLYQDPTEVGTHNGHLSASKEWYAHLIG